MQNRFSLSIPYFVPLCLFKEILGVKSLTETQIYVKFFSFADVLQCLKESFQSVWYSTYQIGTTLSGQFSLPPLQGRTCYYSDKKSNHSRHLQILSYIIYFKDHREETGPAAEASGRGSVGSKNT